MTIDNDLRNCDPGSAVFNVISGLPFAGPIGKVGRTTSQVVAKSWYKSTFKTAEESLEYHFKQHGVGKTIEEYSRDAIEFFSKNKDKAQEVILNDDSSGFLIRDPGNPGGYFKIIDGAIKAVSFWYN